jgi:hypothetical protein
MEATLMKALGVISTTVLFLFLGATLPAFAQEEHHEQEAKPAKQQEQAKPAKQEQQQAKGQQEQQQKQQEQAKSSRQEEQKQAKGQQEQQQKQQEQAKSSRQEEQKQAKGQQEQQQKQQEQAKSSRQEQQHEQQAKGQQEQQQKQQEQAKSSRQEQQHEQQVKGQQEQQQKQQGQNEQHAARQSEQEQHRQEGEQRAAWTDHRAHNWKSEHRDWKERGGYNGYRIPEDRYHGYFGAEHSFRIYTYPVVIVGGDPRFQYGGFWFSAVDPWPEYWSANWYDNDDVYITYADDGYYLYNRRYPQDRIAISVYAN